MVKEFIYQNLKLKFEMKEIKCGLCQYTKEIPTHYISKDGKEYSINEYGNWGTSENRYGKKDLPSGGYPYTLKYRVDYIWKFCNNYENTALA
jgi:hypothetical protein